MKADERLLGEGKKLVRKMQEWEGVMETQILSEYITYMYESVTY